MADDEAGADDERLEFSPTTKKALKAAAGGRCCEPSCLRETDGATKNEKGMLVARGIGVAAHIYSAKKRGPRGQGGLSPEQIENASNGLWTCATHGRQIDDFQSDYTADDLLRMKAVRELAHALQLHDNTIAEFVKHVGIQAWNDCVWDHVADTPIEKMALVDTRPIKAEFISIAVQRLAAIDKLNHSPSLELPRKYKQRSIAAAISSIGNNTEKGKEPHGIASQLVVPAADKTVTPFVRERARALEIAKAWRRQHDPDHSANMRIYDDGQILLSARNPQTGEAIQPGVWQRAHIVSLIHYSPEDGERIEVAVNNSFDDFSEFGWKMLVMIQHGEVKISSHLQRNGLTIPYLPEYTDPAEFWSYYALIEKIHAGWQTIGYVSLLTGIGADKHKERLDLREFEIECTISKEDLALMLARCEKVKVGLGVEQQWKSHYACRYADQRVFIFNGDFFDELVDVQLIRSAVGDLMLFRDANPISPNGWEIGPLRMFNPYVGLFLRCDRKGLLYFTRRVHRTS